MVSIDKLAMSVYIYNFQQPHILKVESAIVGSLVEPLLSYFKELSAYIAYCLNWGKDVEMLWCSQIPC